MEGRPPAIPTPWTEGYTGSTKWKYKINQIDWLHLVGFCEHNDEPSGCIQIGHCSTKDYQLFIAEQLL